MCSDRFALCALVLVLGSPLTPQPRAAGTDGWKRIGPELNLVYPRDHGSHPQFRTEWWYATGNLTDEDGRELGFQFTIFRNGVHAKDPAALNGVTGSLRARHVYAAHLAVADVKSGRTHFAERLRRSGPLASAAESEMDLFVEDWSLTRGSDGRLRIEASDATAGLALDLTLEPARAPVLHGRGGYSRKGAEDGNASAYMSWTRLQTRGTVTLKGRPRAAEGSAWFDHEFGTSVLEPGVEGWDWFGLQLDGGRELMLFRLRGSSAVAAGTWVDANGGTRSLTKADFEITPLETWESPETGARYPRAWRVELHPLGLEFEVRTAIEDAELTTGGSTGVVYWEGPVRVSGGAVGRGYAELTGYAGSMGGRF